jgi:hypothetical protein
MALPFILLMEKSSAGGIIFLFRILSKDYGLAWSNEGPEVILVGVGFDSETRYIGEWIIEKG